MAEMKVVQLNPGAGVSAPGQTVDPNDVIQELGGSIVSIRQEIHDAYADMATFVNRDPDEIMRISSGHSARISFLRMNCLRLDEWRPARDLRTRELEPCLEELRAQWAHGSRLHSTRELDWKMESGER